MASKRKRTESPGNQVVDEPVDEVTLEKNVHWSGDDQGKDSTEEEEDEWLGKICLTAWCLNGRIGCAYFDPVQRLIYILEDTPESSHFDLTKMVLDHSQPDIILTSSKADDMFIDALQTYADESGSLFQIRPHKDFTPTKGRDRLLSLRFFSELTADETDQQASPYLSRVSEAADVFESARDHKKVSGDPTTKRRNAAIRLSNFACADSSPLCISSLGALIDQLLKDRVMNDLSDEGIGGLEIKNIEILSLGNSLHINADALYSLQIFNKESHASVHSEKTKEGLSLFGILDHTSTTLGQSLLRTWLLRPALSIPVINARLDAVECFLRPENLVTANVMHDHLKGVKNMPRTLVVLRSGKAKVSDWQSLVKFTFHSSMLQDALNELHQAGTIEIVKKLVTGMEITELKEIGNAVNEMIDWDESAAANRVCIRPHINQELDNRKNIYHGIDTVLSRVAEQICEAIPGDFASSLNVVYFPQLGFLVCVPMSDEWKGHEGIQAVDGWIFQFASDSHAYFKSPEMQDMDTHIGDLHPTIVDQEIEIVQCLLDQILVSQDAIENACEIYAELDCLLSFAQASRAYNYRRPILVDDNIIEITGGRHPLHEQIVDTFVPNDTHLAGGAGTGYWQKGGPNSVVVCTGANACGKSVYLRQIALIQYMAQIGCFVPAESATLGIVDKIFTRISTRESVSKVQSSFMIDLNQVSLALRNSTARSLLLLDEFGKGTKSSAPSADPIRIDGVGILCGVLKHLLNRGPNCPKVLAATHFHDLFRPDFLDPESFPVAFLHMEVVFISAASELHWENNKVNSGNREDTMQSISDSITYLYRVAPGISRDSHAAQCAEIFGVPHRVVNRARYICELISAHNIGQLLDEKMTSDDIIDLEDAEKACRNFLAWDLQDEDAGGLGVKVSLQRVIGQPGMI